MNSCKIFRSQLLSYHDKSDFDMYESVPLEIEYKMDNLAKAKVS